MTPIAPQARQPQDYRRRILLMVTGRTPQVVTETLYAIAVRPQPPARPFVPTEIHLVTTAEGAQDARLALLDPRDGWLHRLCDDYESNREFFYPTPDRRRLYVEPLKRYFDARDAQVTLAEIPFVRLRDSLPSRFKTLEQGQARFTEVVATMQQALESPAVRIDFRECGLRLADDRLVALPGADLAFYAWLARRRQAGAPPVRIPGRDSARWKPEERALYVGYLAEYETEAARVDLREGVGVELRAVGAMTYPFFHQRKTSIREQLEEAVGPLAEVYAVQALTPGRPAGYGIGIEAERIGFVAEGYL